MVPSMNDQALTHDSWPEFGKGGDCPGWTCDCCVQHWPKMGAMPCAAFVYLPNGADTFAPRMVEVSGIRYFACSEACARALFLIHHQYALREMPAEKRFVHLAYDMGMVSAFQPVILDLDTVSRMAISTENLRSDEIGGDPDDQWIELQWWIDDPQKKFGYGMPRRRAKEIMALWRARPARSLMRSPKPEPVAVP